MKHDDKIDIAIGMAVNSKIWKNKSLKWSQLVQRLSECVKTPETYKEYMSASKSEQGKIKDVGGYVGGYLRNGRRNPQNIIHRQVATLDVDFAHIDFWEDFKLQYHNAAVLHSTHKHHGDSPRYRLIFPLSREATPDEYVAVTRKIAGDLGIELFDDTTFETNRLMFWPSTPKDVDYYFVFQDGEFVDVDEILKSYVDWKDASAWPTSKKHSDSVKINAEKQEDPENKRGIVGSFCRTYNIHQAIGTYLKEIYTPTTDGRYTYSKGSTASGLITYDDKFAYSHHGTDPCGGKLNNAFDLIRAHLFGHLDDGGQQGAKAESYKKMQELVLKDKEVKKVIASDSLAESRYEFAEDPDYDEDEDREIDWMQDLDVDLRGKYHSSAPNLSLIFANDKRLKGLFKYNTFDGKKYIFGTMPWRRVTKPEPMKNVDYAGVRNYIESIYNISASLKIDDALELEFEKNSFHPILDYLRGLKWDGVERVDRLLIDYFGVDDTIYAREAIRKTIVACVARVFNPGAKFDLVLTLVGDQGCGKSTFVKKLGREWFSDTFMTVHGKEALEQIQGAWIIEMAELSGLRKAEVEAVKHFISKQEDSFRAAYARTSETYKRQCVFIGTTNNKDFLRDPSGNRRFIPVDIDSSLALYDVFNDFNDKIVDQVWAEAVVMYKNGEKLFMSNDAGDIAKIEQAKHSESDGRSGIIEEYLNMKMPKEWDKMDLSDRRLFIDDPLSKEGSVRKRYVCAAEIWCECLGKEKDSMDRYKTREINDILKGLGDWEQSTSTRNFKLYGKQKYYKKIFKK